VTDYEACSVDELIELGAAAADGVFDRLGAITATAADDGITVRVNLEGCLVGLELSPHALAAGPAALAASIFRLTQEASATALNAGIEVLAPEVGAELTAELRGLVLPPPAPEPAATAPTAAPRRPVVEDDFSTVESWAVPH